MVEGGPLTAIWRCATVWTAVEAVAVVFVAFGSNSFCALETVSDATPGLRAVTLSVTAAAAPLARVPMVQRRLGAPVQLAPATELKATFGGSGALKVTPVAFAGPLLATPTLYAKALPSGTDDGAPTDGARSARALTELSFRSPAPYAGTSLVALKLRPLVTAKAPFRAP